jgi:hypothetical protein
MLVAAMMFFGLQAAAAQPATAPRPSLVGPVVPRPTVTRRQCENPDPSAEELLVCGQRSDNSPYRIPNELRNQGIVEDRDMSWDARTRDMEAVERFSSANVGPSGMSQNSRRRDCEWRAARQVAQGRQPDCGSRSRPDSDTDWQRSQRR